MDHGLVPLPRVDIKSGTVKMHDRGYEERADLQPNAGVRADGTVHLAPAQITRAAAARAAAETGRRGGPGADRRAGCSRRP